jgi:hypothetical protein
MPKILKMPSRKKWSEKNPAPEGHKPLAEIVAFPNAPTNPQRPEYPAMNRWLTLANETLHDTGKRKKAR